MRIIIAIYEVDRTSLITTCPAASSGHSTAQRPQEGQLRWSYVVLERNREEPSQKSPEQVCG